MSASTTYVLSNINVNANNPSGTTNGVTVTGDDDVFVSSGVDIVDQSLATSCPIYGQAAGMAEIEGEIAGFNGVVFDGQTGLTTTIDIGATGSVETTGNANASVAVQSGDYAVTNDGQIQSAWDAIDVDFENPLMLTSAGSGTIDNTGLVRAGASDYAIKDNGGDQFTNSGQIFGAISEGAGSTFQNSGQITGSVDFDGTVFTDSGSIDGGVTITNTAGAGEVTRVSVTSTGVLESNSSLTLGSPGGNSSAFGYYIVNAGEISNTDSGLGAVAISLYGAGQFINTGTVSALYTAFESGSSAGGGMSGGELARDQTNHGLQINL